MRISRATSASDDSSGPAVDVSWPLRTPGRDPRLLARVAKYAASAEGLTHGSISIAVVGAAAMTRLHWLHMRVAGATDVLTFDFATDVHTGCADGEIVVCAPVAQRAAPGRRGTVDRIHPVLAELALYVVHGVLHLAGYDDHVKVAAREMHAREDELLTEMGLGPVYNPAARRVDVRLPRTVGRRASR